MSDNPIKTITIDLKEAYKIKVEKIEEFEDSIFSDIYKRGFEIVDEIIENTKAVESNIDNYNNVIAFTGERGKGKTSAMVSFQEGLIRYKKASTIYKNLISNSDIKFATIDFIDPSIFNDNESLLKVVITKMFHDFKSKLDGDNCQDQININPENKRKLITQFNLVFSGLRTLICKHDTACQDDSIESLMELSTGSDLKAAFKNLVKAYLKILHNNADYLVLAIDDFDLNHSNAYEMLEDVRKFLVQPNIILLIAAKMDQLNDILLNKNFNEYDNLIKNGDGENVKDELRNKSQRYLDKLIPNSRRLELPSPKIEYDNSIKVEFEGLEDMDGGYLDEISNRESRDFQDAALELIYKRTNIFLAKPRFKTSFIIPDTLRGYLELISNLKGKNKTENRLKLLYYLENNIINNFDDGKVELFRNLKNEKDDYYPVLLLNSLSRILEINRLSTKPIEEYKNLTKKEKTAILEDFNFEKQVLKAKNPNNISIADIATSFRYIQKKLDINSNKEIDFIEFLKIYTSVRINDIEIRKGLLKGGLVNEFMNANKKDEIYIRDFINTNPIFLKTYISENSEDLISSKIWLIYFLPLLGRFEDDFRTKTDDDFYDRMFKDYKLATFSYLYPIISPYIINYDIIEKNDDEDNDLLNKLLEPNRELIEKTKAYVKECEEKEVVLNLFSNVSFYEIFLIELKRQFQNFHKNSIKYNEQEKLRVQIEESFTKTIKRLLGEEEKGNKFKSIKKVTPYKFLKNDLYLLAKVINNPIFDFWEKNEKLIFEELEHLNKKERLTNSQKNDIKLLIYELKKSLKNNPDYKYQTISLWLNRIYKIDSGISEEYKELEKLRDSLKECEDENELDSIKDTKQRITEYITEYSEKE